MFITDLVTPLKTKVLLVDDRKDNLLAYELVLRDSHCELVLAESGYEAIRFLKDNDVAVVLLDVQMPELDGYETAKRIRALPNHQATPIIFVTAIDQSRANILKAYQLGAADFISKPIESEIILAKVSTFIDLFESKNASKALFEFRLIADSMPQMVFVADGDGNIAYYNNRWYEYTGIPKGDVSGKSWASVIYPEDFASLELKWKESHQSRSPWEHEYRIRQANGVYRWHLGRSVPHLNKNGKIDRWIGTVTDIDDFKRAQALMADSEKTLDQIFSESYSFMTVLSVPDFRYLRSNSQHEKLIRKTGFIGKTIIEVEPELEAQGILELLGSVAKSGEPFVGNEVAVHFAPIGNEPARTSYLDFKYQPLKDARGRTYAILAQGHDVTEKVLSRKALEDAKEAIANERENFRNLFKQTPEMVCILAGPEHLFEFTNEAHIKVLGFDATGKTVREAQPESVEVHGILDEVYRTGVTAELREIPVTLGEDIRHFNLTYAARRSESGQVNGVMILGSEVTDVVNSRRILLREAKLIETMPLPFFALDANWQVVYWNPASVEVIGIQQSDIIGRKFWDVFPELENSEFGQNYKMAREQQTIVHFESYYPHFKKWYRVSAFPFESGIAGTFLDVTERKEMEAELEKSKERYQLLFDNSPLPKWIIDVETLRFLEVNNAAIELYGYTKEEFLTISSTEVRPPEDVADFVKTMKMDFSPENMGHINLRRRHKKKDGTIIEVEMSALDLILDGKKARIGAIVDITERVKAEARQTELLQDLRLAKEEAERANRLKSAFLANMSHEIRTPLGAMVGFADLLRDPGLSRTEFSNFIDILIRNGEQLSVIINDILDLSKVESGHLSLELTETYPEKICADVISLLRVKAKEKDLALDFYLEESTPEWIISDPTRLRQVLINLIGNAIKFTQFGSVKVKCHSRIAEDEKQFVCFEVEDTGIGVPASEIENIFKVFVQADGTMTRRFGGTGLGLSLSRKLARSMGGDVKIISSQEGIGTTFYFEVLHQAAPVAPTAHITPPKKIELVPAMGVLNGVRVLVVDDSPDNQRLIWHYLSKQGAIVESADNGLVGYKTALVGLYDIVLMDVQMPVMDGYTATQKLREHGYQKPIIALTAHAMNEVRKECLKVGCTEHLSKPINANELIEVIAKYTNH